MDAIDLPSAGGWAEWLVRYRSHIVAVTLVLLALVLIQRGFGVLRRFRPAAPLNPRLQKYAGKTAAETEADRQAAERILATSSTGRVAGYELVRQIEAVFVEGYRAPEEAVLALKAAAGKLGANALINLSQQRTAAGKCTCQGDAVMLRPKQPQGSDPSANRESPGA